MNRKLIRAREWNVSHAIPWFKIVMQNYTLFFYFRVFFDNLVYVMYFFCTRKIWMRFRVLLDIDSLPTIR